MMSKNMDALINLALEKMGYTLRFYRRFRGLSQTELAGSAGLSFRNYNRIEVGEVMPKLDTLLRLSQALSIPISSILEPSNKDSIGVSEVLTSQELKAFESGQTKHLNKASVLLAEKIYLQDKFGASFDQLFRFEVDSSYTQVEPEFQKHLNVGSSKFNLDEHLKGTKTVDFWEHVHRNRIKQIKVTNFLKFPVGLRVFEGFHQIISSNADAPKSIGYTRDCTARHELGEWIQKSSAALRI